MLLPIHRPKGLNLRQSVIQRPADTAQDLRNLEYTSKGELDLRWGYEAVGSNSGILDLFEYVGAPNDPNRGSLLALKSDGLYKLNGTTLEAVPKGYANTVNWTAKTKPVEYNKVLYWNDPDGLIDLWKFDGFSSYRAGVPKPNFTQVSTTGTSYYFRFILAFHDPQGNITHGDWQQFGSNSDTITVTIDDIEQSYFEGFYQKWANGSAQTVDSGNLTVTVLGHNYLAGDYVLLGDYGGGNRKPILVDSVTATTITFNSADIGSDSYTAFQNGAVNDSNPSEVLEGRWEILCFRSTLPDSNFERVQPASALNNNWILNFITGSANYTWGSSLMTIDGANIPLPSVYDDTLIRVLPPRGKYLALYNEQLFIGGLEKNQPDFGYASLLGNDTRLEDSIVWSDIPTLSNGSSVETFLVNNIRSIGESSDGSIKGIYGNDDNFVVHKDRQSFFINGDFITNTLRVRRAMAEKNGIPSHRSIISIDGGHVITTDRGVYLVAGGERPVEISDMIEPFFTEDALSIGTMDFSNCKAINDFRREKIYFYIPVDGGNGVVLVYDYYYKEWLIHDNIPGDSGFQDVGIESSEVYFANSTNLYKRTLETKTDDGSGITAYYHTNWFNIGAPSMVKKFQNFIVMSITRAWIATVKSYINWDASTVDQQNTVEFTSSQKVMDTQVCEEEVYSASFRISNESDDGNMLITGFEVQLEAQQIQPKGDL
jgi:hypothetical protein